MAIPDLNGNNLIDTLRAIVATGRAGLLVTVPGKDETIRINGASWETSASAAGATAAALCRRAWRPAPTA